MTVPAVPEPRRSVPRRATLQAAAWASGPGALLAVLAVGLAADPADRTAWGVVLLVPLGCTHVVAAMLTLLSWHGVMSWLLAGYWLALAIVITNARSWQAEPSGMALVVAALLAAVVGIGLLARRDRIARRADDEGPAA